MAAREGLALMAMLCAYWVTMRLADRWLKFRAALSDRGARFRVVPKRNGLVSLYTDLELLIKTGGNYGGQRAVFIVELARMEDELFSARLELAERRDADAAMRREEASRTGIRRREAVAETKKKLGVDTQHGCKR